MLETNFHIHTKLEAKYCRVTWEMHLVSEVVEFVIDYWNPYWPTRKKRRPIEKHTVKAAKQEEMLAEISARMDTDLKKMREEIKSGPAELRSTICTFRAELKETNQR
jgi:hypothetical protein